MRCPNLKHAAALTCSSLLASESKVHRRAAACWAEGWSTDVGLKAVEGLGTAARYVMWNRDGNRLTDSREISCGEVCLVGGSCPLEPRSEGGMPPPHGWISLQSAREFRDAPPVGFYAAE